MAQRTVALYKDKYIGIETIYTVVNGRQINIPEKLRELRARSRNNELFCPCGCGANLILVAGDKKLKAADMESRVPIHAVDDIPGTTNSPSCPKAGRRRSAIAMREGICPRKK